MGKNEVIESEHRGGEYMIVKQSGGGLSPRDLVPEKALGIRAENVGFLTCGEEGGILNGRE